MSQGPLVPMLRGASVLLALSVLAGLAATAVAQSRQGIGLADSMSRGSERVVTHEVWAGYLIDSLGLDVVLPEDAEAEEFYSLLCADEVEMTTDAGGRRVPARSAFRVATDIPRGRAPGEPVRVVVDVPGTALYRLAVEGKGMQRWAVDREAVGHLDATPLGVAFAPKVVALREGPHELSAYMNARSRARRVELSALRSLCIAPASGWRSGRPLTFGSKARTMVRALGIERYLPEGEDVVAIEGEDYEDASSWGGQGRDASRDASEDAWAVAGKSPAEFSYRVRLDAPGVYSVLARVQSSGPQIWSLDGRYRAAVEPPGDAQKFTWMHVMTTGLGTGEHVVRALVPRGAAIDLIRVVRRQANDADYVDVLEQMGFREGASSAHVTVGAAHANLANPTFTQLAGDFFSRVAGNGPSSPLVTTETELERLYSRPLSPILPPEL